MRTHTHGAVGTSRGRIRRWWWWVAGIALAVVAAVGVTVRSEHDSNAIGRANSAERLLRSAERVAPDDPRRVTLIRVAAHDLAPSGETRVGLLTALLDAPSATRRIRVGGALQATVVGETVVVASANGDVRAFDIASGRLTGRLELRARPTAIAASRGTDRGVGVGFSDGTAALLSIDAHGVPTEGARLQPGGDGGGSPVVGIGLPFNGAEAIVVHESGAVYDLSSASGTPTRPPGSLVTTARRLGWHAAGLRVTAVEFSDPSPAIGMPSAPATVATNRGVMRVDLATRRGRELVDERSLGDRAVTSLAYAPSEHTEALLGTDRGYSTLASDGELEHDDDLPTFVAQNSGELAAASEEGTIQVPTENGIDSPPAAGRHPASDRAFPAGREPGFVTISKGGMVTVTGSLDDPPSRVPAGQRTSAVGVGRGGELLTTRDTDSGQGGGGVDMVMLGRQGLDAQGDKTDNRFVRSYEPARTWSTAGEDEDPSLGFANTIAVSDRFVLTSGRDDSGTSSVFVWDRPTARPLHRLALTAGPPEVAENTRPGVTRDVMDMTGADRVIVYSTLQESVVGWDPDTWEQVYTRDVGPILSMAADPAGRKLVVAAITETQEGVGEEHQRSDLLIVDAESGEIDERVPIEKLAGATYSPDGKRIATLLTDGRIQLRTADGKDVTTTHHVDDAGSTAIAWSHDGAYLAVVRGDEQVILVDARSGRATPPLPSTASGTATLAFSHDDRYLVARQLDQGDGDGFELLPPSAWRLDRLRQRACALAGADISRDEWRRWIGTAAAYRPLCPSPRSLAPRPAPGSPEPAREGEPPYFAAYATSPDDGASTPTLYGLTGSGRSRRIGEVDFGGTVRWSAGGAMAWTADGRVHLLPAGGAAEQQWPCGCEGVAFSRERVIAVGGTGVDQLEFEAGTPRPVRTTRLRGLPRHEVRILGYDSEGRLLVGGFDAPPDRSSTQLLAVVDPDHTVRKVEHRERGQIHADAPASPADDVVVSFTASGGACSTLSTVQRVRLADRTLHTIPWPGSDPQWASISLATTANGEAAAIATELPGGACPDPPIVAGFVEGGGKLEKSATPTIRIDVPSLGVLTEAVPDASRNPWERMLTLNRERRRFHVTDKLTRLSTP